VVGELAELAAFLEDVDADDGIYEDGDHDDEPFSKKLVVGFVLRQTGDWGCTYQTGP
jgi:hypothetical protein